MSEHLTEALAEAFARGEDVPKWAEDHACESCSTCRQLLVATFDRLLEEAEDGDGEFTPAELVEQAGWRFEGRHFCPDDPLEGQEKRDPLVLRHIHYCAKCRDLPGIVDEWEEECEGGDSRGE